MNCLTSIFILLYTSPFVQHEVTNRVNKDVNMVDNRTHYRRRLSYNTKSNKTKVTKTPGGKLVIQYIKKTASKIKCGDCGDALAGVSL